MRINEHSMLVITCFSATFHTARYYRVIFEHYAGARVKISRK
jgi:hypothetical protein